MGGGLLSYRGWQPQGSGVRSFTVRREIKHGNQRGLESLNLQGSLWRAILLTRKIFYFTLDYYSRAREQQTALKIWPSERLFQHFLVFTSISHHCSQVPPAKPFLQRNKTSAFQQRSECTNLRVQGIFEDNLFPVKWNSIVYRLGHPFPFSSYKILFGDIICHLIAKMIKTDFIFRGEFFW